MIRVLFLPSFLDSLLVTVKNVSKFACLASPHVTESGLRNRGNFCLWKRQSWALESGIPLTIESGIQVPLTKNPESRTWNPESWVQGVKPRIHDCLGFPSSLFGNKIISVESIVGLHAAAHDLDIPWIIIKGISEYKDGRKSGTDCWKKFASLMAASLTVHILSDPMVFRDSPHYTETSKYYNKLPATGICHLCSPP